MSANQSLSNETRDLNNDFIPIVILDYFNPALEFTKKEALELGIDWVYERMNCFTNDFKKYPPIFEFFDYKRKVKATPIIKLKKISAYFEKKKRVIDIVFQFEYIREDIANFKPLNFSIHRKAAIYDPIEYPVREEVKNISAYLTEDKLPTTPPDITQIR